MLARDLIPNFLSKKLWGNRERYGFNPVMQDPEWIEWQQIQLEFYKLNQRKGIGSVVNDSGYSVMAEIDLKDKCILEFGPGDVRHNKFWNSKPAKYIIADVHQRRKWNFFVICGKKYNYHKWLNFLWVYYIPKAYC